MSTIPEWVVKYDKANHQSSAGKAIRILIQRFQEMESKNALNLADAQFIGFSFGKRQPGILDMVGSMGLKYEEWLQWKKQYTTSYLTQDEIMEIDEYFQDNPKS